MDQESTNRPPSCQLSETSDQLRSFSAPKAGCTSMIVANFWVLYARGQAGLSAHELKPDRIDVSVWNQAVSRKSKARAGARGGALVGRPR